MDRNWAATVALAGGLLAGGAAAAQVATGGHFVGTSGLDALQVGAGGASVIRLLPPGGAPSLVCGSDHNEVTDGRLGVTIGGGGGASSDAHRVFGDYATIGGGQGNVAGGETSTDDFVDATVRGGDGNAAIDEAATVGGGSGNLASGSLSTIAGGEQNTAFSEGATLGGGSRNTASAPYATVPGGEDAVASTYGQLAFSSGGFAAQGGDAQASLYVVRRLTTNNTPLELRPDGDVQSLAVGSGEAWAFRVLVAARSETGDSAGYLVTGVIGNVGGATALAGTPTVTVLGEEDPAWNLSVIADDVGDTLSIIALGTPATTIHWVGTVETAEVDL